MGLGNISGANLGPSIIKKAYDGVSDSTKSIASGRKVHRQTALSIIAGQLRGNVAVNLQGVRNANDAVSMVQTFDAAAGSINSNLRRMARLAMQAGAGTFSDEQKATIEAEFNELAAEINRVAGNTQFNGNNLLGGEGAVTPVALGTGPDITIISGDLGLDVSGLDLTADAGGALTAIQENIRQVSDYRGYLGGQMNRLSDAVSVMEVGIENAMAVESGISDTDIAMEVATHTTSRIRAEAAIAMQSQVNVIHQTAVQLLM
jgi:flagellin